MFLQVFLCSLLCLRPCLLQSENVKNMTFLAVEPESLVKFGECMSMWVYNDKVIATENVFNATQSSVGFYFCKDNAHLVHILARIPIKFTQVKASRESYMTGETTIFNCYTRTDMSFGPKYSITLEITDPSGVRLNYLTKKEHRKDQIQFNVTHDHTFVGYGIQIFFCSLVYNSKIGNKWNISHSEFKTLNMTVYQPPTNVKPDILSVPVGKDVMCTSEGYPNPDYKWVCQGDGWTTNGENLTVYAASLTCTCNARAMINGKLHEGSWDGTIRGIGGGTKIFLTGILIIATAFAHVPDA